MRRASLILLMSLILSANAYGACPDNPIVIGPEPIEVNSPCFCASWEPGPDPGPVHHYHLLLDSTLAVQTTDAIPGVDVCLPEKEVVYSMQVLSVGSSDVPPSPISDPTTVVWKDLICEVTIIVPPNPDGTCPEG